MLIKEVLVGRNPYIFIILILILEELLSDYLYLKGFYLQDNKNVLFVDFIRILMGFSTSLSPITHIKIYEKPIIIQKSLIFSLYLYYYYGVFTYNMIPPLHSLPSGHRGLGEWPGQRITKKTP